MRGYLSQCLLVGLRFDHICMIFGSYRAYCMRPSILYYLVIFYSLTTDEYTSHARGQIITMYYKHGVLLHCWYGGQLWHWASTVSCARQEITAMAWTLSISGQCICAAKNLGLIQPCFSCTLVSSHGLAGSSSWLLSLTNPIFNMVTQVWMSDLLPSKHKLCNLQ